MKSRKILPNRLIISLLSLFLCLSPAWKIHADGLPYYSLNLSNAVLDPGQNATVTLNISSSDGNAVMYEASVSVTGGLSASTVKLVSQAPQTSFSVPFTVTATGEGDQTVSVSLILINIATGTNGTGSAAVNLHVRTAAEKQAAEEAARRQAEEQRKAQESRQAEEASKNAAIASSVSEEESKKQASYEEESKKIESSIEESVENLTKETEIEKLRFIPYYYGDLDSYGCSDTMFFFATSDVKIDLPEEYLPVLLEKNGRKILAFRSEKMDPDTFLVYGMFHENDSPKLYYYHEPDELFFDYEYLNGSYDIDVVLESESNEPKASDPTEPERPVSDLRSFLFTAIPSFLIGLLVALWFFSFSAHRKMKKQYRNEELPPAENDLEAGTEMFSVRNSEPGPLDVTFDFPKDLPKKKPIEIDDL